MRDKVDDHPHKLIADLCAGRKINRSGICSKALVLTKILVDNPC